MKENFLGIILSIMYLNLNLSFGQKLQEGQKRWSSEKKLTVDDFKTKISDANNEAIYS